MKVMRRQLILLIFDIFFIYLANFLSLFLVSSQEELGIISSNLSAIIIISIIIRIVLYCIFKLYSSIWIYAGADEFFMVLLAVASGSCIIFIIMSLMDIKLGIGFHIVNWMFNVMFTGGSRFAYRFLRIFRNHFQTKKSHIKNVLIYGAGDAGALVIKELKNHIEMNLKPVAVLDDDKLKHHLRINGVPVIGGREQICKAVEKYNIQQIIIAMPSVSRREIRSIIEICKNIGCKLKTIPGMYELIDGKVDVKKLRDIEIEDLLGREPVQLNNEEIIVFIKDEVVLVTGAGGSIGSELCHQIASFEPAVLLLFDIYENHAYSLELELKKKYPVLKIAVLIGSVRDKTRVEQIFSQYKPGIVFHAAAHKHVPLMEENPMEAVKNNVFGTINVSEAAHQYGSKKFVLISTDKAVNPTNIMGATKRIAEIFIQFLNENSTTDFAAVRFGNVLGSDGSVIPLFRKQIALGGPVTVTHPDIIRYFMTISEAVGLVLQAGSMAKGGEIFILDMGEPVKILDLAKDLIRLSGFTPETDISIKFVGLRPGEKLYEELLIAEEGLVETYHEKIMISHANNFFDKKKIEQIYQLKEIANFGNHKQLYQAIQDIVPTFKTLILDDDSAEQAYFDTQTI
jgi:FlaA1/EpsC-like NDP-sugar epimerase